MAGQFKYKERNRKWFSLLWRPCEAHTSLCVGKGIGNNFYHCECPVNLVHTHLSVRKDPVSTFHSYGGPVKLVHASLNV